MNPNCYKRIAKPLTSSVRVPRIADIDTEPKEARPIVQPLPTVPASLECHVTPPDVAEYMAQLLDIEPVAKILEPSAGTGSLLNAVKDLYPEADLQAVEIYEPLQIRLQKLGFNVACADFSEWAKDKSAAFDAVIMNPPFKRVKGHIKAAFDLLKPGGCLVALVPATYQGGETMRNLSNDTFKAAKVNTKIIIKYKD